MPVNPSSNRSYAGQSGTFQSASAIAAHGLTKSYGQTLAVFDLSFEVAPGTALGLLGPNGAGKSTTMLMLAGVLKPDGGHVRIMGEVGPTRAKVRRHIGYAPQSLALYPELTAIENLQLLARLHGISRRTLQERVAQALELARLAERLIQPLDQIDAAVLAEADLLPLAVAHDLQAFGAPDAVLDFLGRMRKLSEGLVIGPPTEAQN